MANALELRLGDHVCLPFDSDATAWAHAVSFSRAGLTAGQRVMLFPHVDGVATVRHGLRRHDPALAAALSAGQLQVHRPQDVHLEGGRFEPERLIAALAAATAQAVTDGYRGLRITVDMTWALARVPGVERLYEFETGANRLFLDRQLAAVCAYDRRRFDAGAVQRACAAHPTTAGGSALRFVRSGRAEVRLAGEVDLTNEDAFGGVLAALPDADVTVDLTGVSYLGVAGVQLLARSAARRAHRTTVRCTPTTARLLRLLHIDQVAVVAVAGH